MKVVSYYTFMSNLPSDVSFEVKSNKNQHPLKVLLQLGFTQVCRRVGMRKPGKTVKEQFQFEDIYKDGILVHYTRTYNVNEAVGRNVKQTVTFVFGKTGEDIKEEEKAQELQALSDRKHSYLF